MERAETSQLDWRWMAFQFGGSSSSKLPPRGEWRCLLLANVEDVRLRAGPWREGGSHNQQQRCVEDIDLDVNVHVRKPGPISGRTARKTAVPKPARKPR